MKYFLPVLVGTLLCVPVVLLAQTFTGQYSPLIGSLPGYSASGGSFATFINGLYAFSISIAAILAVLKIIIAGVKWMLTDIVSSKSDAKKDIRSALFGLLLILAAFLILNLINPNLLALTI
jgi:hypothetical protein